MTVFRVDVDHDQPTLVRFDRNRFLKYHTVGDAPPPTRGVESLSLISMRYYHTYLYWPVIWLDNSDAYTFLDPNKTYRGQTLLIRRHDRIGVSDKMYARKLFDTWKEPSATRAAKVEEVRRDIEARERARRFADFVDPDAWQKWEPEPEWARWNR